MNQVSYKQVYKVGEVWYQDGLEPDLWHHDKGLMINTAALDEREAFFEVTRVAVNPKPADVTSPAGQRA